MEKIIDEAYSFDDLLIIPRYSEILPSEVDVTTQLTRSIRINIPLVSAPMDTVTESKTSIVTARSGGLSFIHKNMSISEQASEVSIVKKSESGMIFNPETVNPGQSVGEVLAVMKRYKISGVPVVRDGNYMMGIVTNRDLRFEKNMEKKVSEIMTPIERLIFVNRRIGLEKAKEKLHEHRIEKLPVINKNGILQGMYTVKDIEKDEKYPNACKDEKGRLRVGAAVGVGPDLEERLDALIQAGVDVVVIDASHGHSKNVIRAVERVRSVSKIIQLIAGNIGTSEAATALIKTGVDAVKIGIGPGSICTTRIIAGVGIPQITAIINCLEQCEKAGIPMIADGGIRYSGDITKAIGAGAHSVMIGGLFAGTDEAPGERVFFQGRYYKVYRGMGSEDAMREGSKDRYNQEDLENEKLVPEGIVGRVPYRGSLDANIFQLVGGLRSGMGSTGCKCIEDLRGKVKFYRISPAGMKESHVHDVIITKEAPNYRVE